MVAVLAVYYSSQTSHNRARAHLATPYLDRLYLEPFRLVGDPRVIEDARLWMPEEATYRVVTGPNVRLRKPATLESAIALVRFHLMPRRLVAGPAGWVLCYGCRRSLLGDRFQVLSDGGNGVVFGRMR
ncbi:MAG TPA: hypothetical protein VNJ53_10060 [Gaiellaceae bacterium]|nr:hypothetical protein [Gaiellaceae bacterium]